MKNLAKSLILVLFTTILVGFANPALAYYPTLNVYSSGSDTSITISGGQPDASVVINYTPSGSSLPTTITGTTDSNGNFTTDVGSVSSQITATVGGQQVVSNASNSCSYNCGNPSGLSLSQTSLNLNVGQTVAVTASSYSNYNNTFYISGNTNSSVASVSVSGQQLNVYGLAAGSTTINVCANNGGQCASLYVAVGGNNNCAYYNNCNTGAGLTLSQTSLSLSVGQTATVSVSNSVYGYSTGIYISSNNNSSIAGATVSGNNIYINALAAGATTFNICQTSNSQCAQLYVTVGGAGCTYNCGGALSLSQTSLNLNIGQTATVTATYPVYGNINNLYVSSNTNPSIAGATVSGANVYVNALNTGSTTFDICQTSGSPCAPLYVTVSGINNNCSYSGCNNGLSLTQTNLTLNVGQSMSVSAYNVPSLYVSSNSNSSVVSVSISSNQAIFYGQNNGSSTVVLCGTSSSQCANVYVTVSGSVLGASNYAVNMYDDYFSPKVITIPAGASIVWTNDGSMGHTVTADDGSFNSGTIAPGAAFTRIFYTPGTYAYHCIFHGGLGGIGMSGTVIVTGSSSGNLALSQTSLSLSVGQSANISVANNAGSIYVSSNTYSNVASYSVSGNNLSVTALTAGSTTLNVCSTYANGCASVYITVSGGNSGVCTYYGCPAGVTLSQTSLNLALGQTSTVSIYGGLASGYYVATNSNSSVAGATVSGNSLFVNGINNGTANITVCSTSGNNGCATVYITVGGGNYSGSGYSAGGTGLQYPGSGSAVLGASAYPNGELIAMGQAVYIVYKNTVTGFTSASVFTGLGFKFSNVIQVGNSGLVSSGYTVSTQYASHPWGSWIKSGSTIYFVQESGLIPVPNWATFLNNGGQQNLIVSANTYDFRLPILTPMTLGDSRLQ